MKPLRPTVDNLHALLLCNPETGDLIWRERSRDWFTSDRIWKSHNARYSGTPALSHVDTLGYRNGYILRYHERAHRVVYAMFHGHWPTGVIDHINGIRTDNRISNLRDVQQSENCRNSALRSSNKTGVHGVSFFARDKTWQVHIVCPINGKISLGRFTDIEEAKLARLDAQKRLGYHTNHGRIL